MITQMTTIKETWKPIAGWEESHCVSNLGRIKSSKRTIINPVNNAQYVVNDKIMKSNLVGAGYMGLILGANGIKKRYIVSRLVAIAFIVNPENKPCVNHIDGDKLNNAVSNLEWCTHKENTIHGFKTGLMSTKITQVEADQIRQLYSTGKYRQSDIGKMFDLTQGTIGKIVRNELWIN